MPPSDRQGRFDDERYIFFASCWRRSLDRLWTGAWAARLIRKSFCFLYTFLAGGIGCPPKHVTGGNRQTYPSPGGNDCWWDCKRYLVSNRRPRPASAQVSATRELVGRIPTGLHYSRG